MGWGGLGLRQRGPACAWSGTAPCHKGGLGAAMFGWVLRWHKPVARQYGQMCACPMHGNGLLGTKRAWRLSRSSVPCQRQTTGVPDGLDCFNASSTWDAANRRSRSNRPYQPAARTKWRLWQGGERRCRCGGGVHAPMHGTARTVRPCSSWGWTGGRLWKAASTPWLWRGCCVARSGAVAGGVTFPVSSPHRLVPAPAAGSVVSERDTGHCCCKLRWHAAATPSACSCRRLCTAAESARAHGHEMLRTRRRELSSTKCAACAVVPAGGPRSAGFMLSLRAAPVHFVHC